MNNKEAKILAADLGGEISQVDLHGLYPDEALDKLEQFIFACFSQKVELGRVVFGAGTGKLREKVLNYLDKHPQIEEIVDRSTSCLVLF